MNLNDLTIGQAKELASMLGGRASNSTSLQVGKSYLIRTVTHYFTGRIIAITDTDVVLEDAAWIADTGRFSDALTSFQLAEVEPYPGQCIVFRGGMIDASEWVGPLPRSRK